MAKRRHTAEQIISKLREAEVSPAKDQSLAKVIRKLERPAHRVPRCRARLNPVLSLARLPTSACPMAPCLLMSTEFPLDVYSLRFGLFHKALRD